LALVLASCSGGSTTPAANTVAGLSDSTLDAGDSFEVSVYGQEDLSGKYRIDADGRINFPLVGLVSVATLSPTEIALVLQDALREKQILRDPHVSVFPLEQQSRQVSVMGAVDKPGSYPLAPNMTVIKAISVAGGLTPLASGDNTIITRRVDGQLERFKVPVSSISEGKEPDFVLQKGDIIFVPERVF